MSQTIWYGVENFQESPTALTFTGRLGNENAPLKNYTVQLGNVQWHNLDGETLTVQWSGEEEYEEEVPH